MKMRPIYYVRANNHSFDFKNIVLYFEYLLFLIGCIIFVFCLGAGWAVIHFDLNNHPHKFFKKHR